MKRLTITLSDGETSHTIEGIPEQAWNQFTENAKKHFPKDGDNAWGAYLTEVIMAVSGGDKTVTYFMTNVPYEHAEAIHLVLDQVGFTWDKFHAYLLLSAMEDEAMRIVRFHNKGKMQLGTIILTNINPIAFTNIEKASGHSLENVLGALIIGAEQGTITFAPENVYPTPL